MELAKLLCMKIRFRIRYLILLGVIIRGAVNTAEAQTPAGIFRADALTYRYYLEQKWDSLTHAGKTFIRNGIDFYYLRMRMGIAYYEKHKYSLAIPHFRKALQFDPSSQVALEYLYYSYLFINREMDAHLAGTDLSPETQVRLGIQPRFITGFSADYTYRTFRPEPFSFPIPDAPEGKQQIPEQMHNLNLTFTQFAGKRVRLIHSFTNFKQQSTYYEKTLVRDYLFTSWLNQYQYYLNVSLQPLPGVTVSTWGHYIYLHYPYVYEKNSSRIQILYAYQNDYLAGVSARLTGRLITMDYSYSQAWFGSINTQQHTAGIGIYPLGNLNLYTTYNLNFLKQNPESNFHNIQQITAGLKITSKCWSEIGLSEGKMYNFSDATGYIVYNQENPYTLLAHATLYFLPSSRWSIYIKGSFLKGESRFTSSQIIMNQINFTSYSITGGVSWKL